MRVNKPGVRKSSPVKFSPRVSASSAGNAVGSSSKTRFCLESFENKLLPRKFDDLAGVD